MKSVLKLCIAVLFTFVVSFMTTNSALALGQFSLTCRDTSIQGSVLTSTCERASGGVYNTSSINLNRVVENVDGSLKWQPSNFIETCRSTQVVASRLLSAQCKTRAQQWVSTTINLDDHIANIDGTLRFE
ncbi:CVNH domain-containing protein [Nostoc sp. FACHB-280]|uniref:mannose-binding lectin n=1 Tax=Nostoc sp. FACHB-280 TaxID=2692839 RepID=UPI00168A6D03|nr:CVNH domain-containing protein [Nostoc sp. FACHB-280]MBD2493776.1 cyanovirin [Nostoc sp. FACHB-280]